MRVYFLSTTAHSNITNMLVHNLITTLEGNNEVGLKDWLANDANDLGFGH